MKARIIYRKYYDSIKMGLLMGLLISNVYLLVQQGKTLDRVLDISKQIKETNQLTIDYVQCIALIHPDFRTQDSIQKCVTEGLVPTQIRATSRPTKSNNKPTSSKAPVPTVQTNPTPKQTPTTSTPPEEPRKNPVRRVGERLTELSDVLESVIKGVLGDDTK